MGPSNFLPWKIILPESSLRKHEKRAVWQSQSQKNKNSKSAEDWHLYSLLMLCMYLVHYPEPQMKQKISIVHSEHLQKHLSIDGKLATYHRRRKVCFLSFQPLFQADRNTLLFVTAPRCDSYYNICVQLSLHMSLLLARQKEEGPWLGIIQGPWKPVGVCVEGLGRVREITEIVPMKFNYHGILSHAVSVTSIYICI